MPTINVFHSDDDNRDEYGNLKKRPPWAWDFCDYLAMTYQCPREAFPQDLMDVINAFTLYGGTNMPHVPGQEMFATSNTGSKAKIQVQPNRVHCDSNEFNLQAAIEMALLCKANPHMMANGVTLDGTPEEQAMLLVACEIVGLKLKSQPQADPALVAKLRKSIGNEFQATEKACRDECARQKDDKISMLFNEHINNPPSDNIKNKIGDVTPEQYCKIKHKVWEEQNISHNGLKSIMKDFSIAEKNSDRVMEAMKDEGFVYKPNDNSHAVRFSKDCRWCDNAVPHNH